MSTCPLLPADSFPCDPHPPPAQLAHFYHTCVHAHACLRVCSPAAVAGAMPRTLQGSEPGRSPSGLCGALGSRSTRGRRGRGDAAGSRPCRGDGQKGRPGALPCASAAEIRSRGGGGLPPGSQAAFQAKPFTLSSLQQPEPQHWLREGYPVLLQAGIRRRAL